MHGLGIVRRSLIWTVFSSRMRLPASQDSTTFCAIWSCGPAAGPSGLAAPWPWKTTDVSRSGAPFQNLRAGRSKIFCSRSCSRNMRRTRLAKGAGASSAMEATCSHERGVSRAAGYAALRSVSTSPDASAAHRGHRPFDGRRLRRIALLIAAACLVPAVLDGWQFYLQAKLAGEASVSWRFVAFQAGEWIILGALMSLVWTMAVRFPFDRPHLGARVAAHLGGALLLCAGWALCGVALRAALGLLPGDEPLARHLAGWLLTSLPWSVFMYFAMLGCLLAFAYFTEAREREAAAARLTAQVAEARLAALRAQIHPHFLFNSLNAVAVLARDGRTTDAVRVVEQLSDLLRELLAGDDTATVPLAREIAFVEKYLSIESTRFPDRLEVRWEVAP